jgi:cation diffusion facilitator CzcD-associated flavoprotein CzcO
VTESFASHGGVEVPGESSNSLNVDVLIVGGGFSGLCMAIKLREAGLHSFLLIEKSEDVGGTWWDNRYPGCACDIPSHLYSFSFELSPDWTRMYPGQAEIHAYMKRCVEKYRLAPHIRLKTRLCKAVWSAAENLWEVSAEESGGTAVTIRARALVSAMGGLHVPYVPKLPGIERFKGSSFHSAGWNHGVDLTGENVAVVGTGASAIQFVPQIAAKTKKLNLFQRTPPWIVPRMDYEFSEKAKKRFRSFWLARWIFRQFIFWRQEIRVLGFLGNKFIRGKATEIAQRHLERQVASPELRAALTPKYELGCKRVLVSDDFYPTLVRDNVELITASISEVRERSIVTVDGLERPLDVLIYGTGFRATEPLIGVRIVGRDGVEIHDAWRERMAAYYGVTVSGFPNFFVLLGPNTGLGHNSIILMTEAQVRYTLSCLKMLHRRKRSVIEVREGKQKAFVSEMQRRLMTTVWQTGGCKSWYQEARTGENTTLWPGTVIEYVRRTRHAALADYKLS